MITIRNEKGFMLILTLLIISVISIFLLSFIQISATQNKQVEQTSNTYEVTSVAEMGVEYYDALIRAQVKTVIENAQRDIASIKNNPNIVDKETASLNIINSIPSSINQLVYKELLVNKEVEIDDTTLFKLEKTIPTESPWILNIESIIKVNSIVRNKKIKATITLPQLEKLLIIYSSIIESSEGGDGKESNTGNDSKFEINPIYFSDGSHVYFNSPYKFNLTKEKKQINLKGVFFIGQDIILNDANKNNNNSLTLNNTTMVGKTITLTNPSPNNNNNLIKLDSKSKICLLEAPETSGKVQQIFTGHGHVYILGDSSKKSPPGQNISYLNKSTFEETCGVKIENGNILPDDNSNPDSEPKEEIEKEYINEIELIDTHSFITDVKY